MIGFCFLVSFWVFCLVWEGDAHNAAAVAWLKEGKAVDDSSDSTARNFNITASVFIICISTCFGAFGALIHLHGRNAIAENAWTFTSDSNPVQSSMTLGFSGEFAQDSEATVTRTGFYWGLLDQRWPEKKAVVHSATCFHICVQDTTLFPSIEQRPVLFDQRCVGVGGIDTCHNLKVFPVCLPPKAMETTPWMSWISWMSYPGCILTAIQDGQKGLPHPSVWESRVPSVWCSGCAWWVTKGLPFGTFLPRGGSEFFNFRLKGQLEARNLERKSWLHHDKLLIWC